MKWQVPLLMIAVCLGTVAQAQVWRVDPTSPGTQDGLSWATAFHTIQPAIDAAYAAGGGEVWVAGGTIGSPRVYNELRTEAWGSPASVTGSLVMKDNVHVYGGFSGYNGGAGRQETQRSQRNWYLYPAVIDGSTSRAGSPAYHVVVFGRASAPTVNARLDGFTITGGNASGVTGDYHTWRGGGIYAWQSAAEVENCIIHNCTAAVSGGAIANETGPNGQSLSLIRSCLIRNNTANRAADSSANPIRGGAGIFNNNADAVIVGCTIVDGTLTDNTTGLFGRDSGGVYNWESAPIINNCIFYLNTGDGATGSVVSQGSLGNTEVPVFSYTLAGVTFPGTGNIGGVNPQLDTNYVPLASSPVINVGNPGLTTGTDNRGVARQVGPSADIGAMEYSPNGPSAVCQSASVDLTVRNQITDPAEISLSTAEAGIWLQEVENKTFSCSDIPSGTLQLTVTDVLGRTATCTATINVTESEPPVITLNGASVVTVECGTAYTEQGATATDNCDTNVTISIAGTVDTANPGDYVLTYTATDDVGNSASVQRTVQVRDTTPPPLTLNGPDPMVVECGSTFTDPGVTVADSCDMMVAYTVSGTVDTSVPGSYTLTYNAQDGSGNVAVPITRVVNVVDTTAPVITLNGASPMTVECGSTFTDPGANAVD
ncbi:MAG TPA: DUF5011 domain-containing protein, partial [Candidatus Hydrogenedentes bacterium]|nr:DUF5011 domain-containing protein [Candidatus Hydrogenedentota bacterium]